MKNKEKHVNTLKQFVGKDEFKSRLIFDILKRYYGLIK